MLTCRVSSIGSLSQAAVGCHEHWQSAAVTAQAVVRSSTALVFSAALPANTVNAAPLRRVGKRDALEDWRARPLPKPAGGSSYLSRRHRWDCPIP